MKKIKNGFVAFLVSVMVLTAMPINTFAASKPATPSISVSTTTTTATIKWKKTARTTGYKVYRYYPSTKKSKLLKTTKKTSYKVSKLSAGTTYTYYVKSYKKSGKKTVYGKNSSKKTVSTKPNAVKNFKKSANTYSSVSLQWSKQSTASSYRIQYSTNKNFSSGVKSVNTNSVSKTISSLTANKTYYFKIRPYRTVKDVKYFGAESSVISVKTALPKQLTTVTKSNTYQTMYGFGCSAAWWSKTIGGWDNAPEIMELLYGTKKGIGLNIYRYNLGAGSNEDDKVNPWNNAESFLDENGNYDFAKDENARNCLTIANSLSSNLSVTLFSNSAPYQFTKNGRTYSDYQVGTNGKEIVSSNIDESRYGDFADYVLDCAEYFSEQGFNVKEVAPINEPEWSWQAYEDNSAKQEGCHYTPAEAQSFYSTFIGKMESRNLIDKFGLGLYESGKVSGTKGDFTKYMYQFLKGTENNNKTLNYLKNVSSDVCGHSYWTETNEKVSAAEYFADNNLSYRMTEYCQMIGGTQGLEMSYGLDLANTIYEDLTILNAKEWDWWVGVSSGIYCDGLVYVDKDSHKITTSKRLYALGNFSKFIEEGATRVKTTSGNSKIKSCAFLNKDGSLVIVYINSSSSAQTDYINVSGYSKYSVHTTDAKNNLKNTKNANFSNYTGVSIPAGSVTTIVLNK